jgi:hypothetical protein
LGEDIDARNGIITDHTAGVFNNLSVHDVAVKNIYLRGIYASSGGTFNISNNTVTNVRGSSSSIGIFNFGGSGVIQANAVNEANDAIAANNSTGTQFLNNIVTNSDSGVHSDNNGSGGVGVADLIQGNSVWDGTGFSYGVWVFAAYKPVLVKDNAVTNVNVALGAFGSFAPITVTFDGNHVDAEDLADSYGAYVSTTLFGFGSADIAAQFINSNTLKNATYGLYVEQESGSFTTKVSAVGNAITGNGTGVYVDRGTAKLQGNDLTGNTIGLHILNGAAVDAGQAGRPSPSDFTGLGISTGGNDFSSYSAAASATAGAIVMASLDPTVGPNTTPPDATAFGNTWHPTLTSSALIASVVYDDADESGLAFVDYASLANLQTDVSSATVNENGVITLTGSFTNDAQPHVLTINWGDGTADEVINLPANTFTFSVPHTYLDDNPAGTLSDLNNISVQVEEADDPLAVLTSSESVTVLNVDPQILTLSATSVNEDGTVTLSGTYFDVGTQDTHQLTIDWGEGAPEVVSVTGGAFSFTHQYKDDNPTGTASDTYTIGALLTDDDTGSDSSTTTANISNVAPQLLTLAVTPTVNENGTVTLSGTYTDVGTQDTHTLSIDWGDGNTQLLLPVSGGSFSFTHQYLDDNPTGTLSDSTTINVTLADDDTGTATGNTTTVVTNVAPQLLSLSVTPTINENGTVTLSGTYSDVGTQDTHTLTINWGEGGPQIVGVSGGSFSFTHQYLDDKPSGTSSDVYGISVTLADDDTATATGSTSTTVNNVAPLVAITGSPGSSPEGTPITLGVNITDPGTLDTFSFSWTVLKNGSPYATGSGSSITFTPNDGAATYSVAVGVTDDDTGFGSASTSINVTNVSPTIVLTGAASVNEGQLYTLNLGAVTDPGTDTITQIFVFWGDNPVPQVYPATVIGSSVTHTYDDNAAVTGSITVTLVDEDGAHPLAGSLSRTVNNVAPTAFTGDGGAVSEGSNAFVFFAGQFDPSNADTTAGFKYSYDFNNDGDFADAGEIFQGSSSSAVVPATYVTDDPSRTVRMRIEDKDGGFADFLETFTINNVAPVVNAGADTTATQNSLFSRTISFTDPGQEGTWQVSIDWDGDTVADETFSTSTHTPAISHTFTSTGAVNVTVTVNDFDGGVHSDSFLVNVVPDVFRVIGFTQTASGFEVQFNRSPDLAALNLYDGNDAPVELPDLTVQRNGSPVNGSIVWNSATNTLSWVKTGGVLLDGNYTINLVSGDGRFEDLSGQDLDGNNDFTPGGNYTQNFTIAPSTARVVYIPDIARGPGQDVHWDPDTAPPVTLGEPGENLPIRIDNGNGVSSIDVNVVFDPTLLTISNVFKGSNLPANWSITANMADAATGLIRLTLSGITPLSGSNLEIVELDAFVPSTAPYGASQVIRLEQLRVNEDTIASKADFAVHKAVYLGDADGDTHFGAFDAAFISRTVVLLDSGFDAHDWTDPVIIGDTTGDGTLSGLDASYVGQKAALLPRPEIPDDPNILPAHVSGGVDPTYRVADNIAATPGGTVVVPIQLDIEPTATTVLGATFDVYFDWTKLSVDPFTGVTNGASWPDSNWLVFASTPSLGRLRVVVFSTSGTPSSTGLKEIVNVQFAVASAAPLGSTPIDVEQGIADEGGLTWTDDVDDGSVWIASPSSTVEGRKIFYNRSAFDGNNAAANAADDSAIDTTKTPLLRGAGPATFANYTSYSRGINGLMIDIEGLNGTPTLADFTFKMGNDSTPSAWAAAPSPTSITVRPGAGANGSDRVTLIWPDYDPLNPATTAVAKKWLEVTVLDTAITGLSEPDVFYVGNAIGDVNVGNLSTIVRVDSSDESAIRANPHHPIFSPAPVTDPYDLNRDKAVDATDQIIARANPLTALNGLRLIDIPAPPPPMMSLASHEDAVDQSLAQGPDWMFYGLPSTGNDDDDDFFASLGGE